MEPNVAEDGTPTKEAEEIGAAAGEEVDETRDTDVVVVDDP